jgi:hypothetical protein
MEQREIRVRHFQDSWREVGIASGGYYRPRSRRISVPQTVQQRTKSEIQFSLDAAPPIL